MKKKNKENYKWVELTDEQLKELEEMETCDKCINCLYIGEGDFICDIKQNKLVLEDFTPASNYMWCGGKYYEEG